MLRELQGPAEGRCRTAHPSTPTTIRSIAPPSPPDRRRPAGRDERPFGTSRGARTPHNRSPVRAPAVSAPPWRRISKCTRASTWRAGGSTSATRATYWRRLRLIPASPADRSTHMTTPSGIAHLRYNLLSVWASRGYADSAEGPRPWPTQPTSAVEVGPVSRSAESSASTGTPRPTCWDLRP